VSASDESTEQIKQFFLTVVPNLPREINSRADNLSEDNNIITTKCE